jgi:hypothetical protein
LAELRQRSAYRQVRQHELNVSPLNVIQLSIIEAVIIESRLRLPAFAHRRAGRLI